MVLLWTWKTRTSWRLSSKRRHVNIKSPTTSIEASDCRLAVGVPRVFRGGSVQFGGSLVNTVYNVGIPCVFSVFVPALYTVTLHTTQHFFFNGPELQAMLARTSRRVMTVQK